ncbi:MAG: type IV pilus modification protein PilV [Zoogloeaceae bacterium]|nr:type IV pilus modification protein PilV [Zoogloeaceae bacterium]
MMNGNKDRAGGFSLLEVLVTALILNIGILGLLGSQMAALKMNQAAISRSIASEYAYAMVDKIRGDAAAARNGDYDVRTLTLASGIVGQTGTVAEKERALWALQLSRALPGALVQICRKISANETFSNCADTGDFFMVRVAWQQGADDKLLFDATNTGTSETFDSQSVEVVGHI